MMKQIFQEVLEIKILFAAQPTLLENFLKILST